MTGTSRSLCFSSSSAASAPNVRLPVPIGPEISTRSQPCVPQRLLERRLSGGVHHLRIEPRPAQLIRQPGRVLRRLFHHEHVQRTGHGIAPSGPMLSESASSDVSRGSRYDRRGSAPAAVRSGKTRDARRTGRRPDCGRPTRCIASAGPRSARTAAATSARPTPRPCASGRTASSEMKLPSRNSGCSTSTAITASPSTATRTHPRARQPLQPAAQRRRAVPQPAPGRRWRRSSQPGGALPPGAPFGSASWFASPAG